MTLKNFQFDPSKSVPNLFPFPGISTVINLIREQTQNNPENPALKLGDKYLSYQELEEKSDELALKLRQKGIFKEDKVAVMFPLSFELVISIYAILKAGGAYVPINATDGKDRIKFILEDLHGRFVLGNTESLVKVSELTNASLWEINLSGSDWISDFREPQYKIEISKYEETLLPDLNPKDLAYIIYTSGTTGRPKGVMVEHRNLNSFILSMRTAVDIKPGDRFLQNPNITFDFSVGTMFMSLCNGSTLVLWQGDLEKVLVEEKITHYLGTPGAALLIDPKNCPSLKAFAVGGEKVPDEFINRFAPHCQIFDAYGPAECTIIVSWTHLNSCKSSHIGTVLPDVEFFVVTPEKTLAAEGESGELWIAGDFVARGYLNRPDLTEEKFLANPFGKGRIYKTGDKVRWSGPGVMEYLGRIDRQVKIRGHRLELDEIEKLINGFPGIKGTLAKVFNDNLVAYVTTENKDLSPLLAFLGDNLPQYAIPSKIIPLKSFPLNRSGKIDTSLLPNPFENTFSHGRSPQTINQIEMAKIWSSILFGKKEKLAPNTISLEDNFFDLGGNSLTALKLTHKLRDIYSNTNIPLELIYKRPLLEGFTSEIETFLSKETTATTRLKKIPIMDIVKCLPSTFYFILGYLFPAIAFTILFFSFPIIIFYYFFELIFFELIDGRFPPILQKIRNKFDLDKFNFKTVDIIETTPIKSLTGNIFCIHPHGLMDFHMQALEKHFYKKEFPIRTTFHKTIFLLPFARTLLFLLGNIPAGRETFERFPNKKINIFTTPGDVSEYLLCHEPSTISLYTNELFFKLAIENGSTLIPVYAFDTEKSFRFYPEFNKLIEKLKIGTKKLAIVPFSGKFFLPLPFKTDCKIVVGEPVHFEKKKNPTWSEIQTASSKYSFSLKEIHKNHKPEGSPELIIK